MKVFKGLAVCILISFIVVGGLFIAMAGDADSVKKCALQAIGGAALAGLSLMVLTFIVDGGEEEEDMYD